MGGHEARGPIIADGVPLAVGAVRHGDGGALGQTVHDLVIQAGAGTEIHAAAGDNSALRKGRNHQQRADEQRRNQDSEAFLLHMKHILFFI